MDLRLLTENPADWQVLEAINEEAIPENERNSLRDMAATGADVFGLYEEDTPVGFMIIRKYRDIVYLAYLAVRADLRSRGTGSRALRELIRRYPDRRIVVEFEAPDEPGNPASINTRRKNFYLRGGFRETGWYTFYDETEFEIGCAGRDYDPQAFSDFTAYLGTIISDHIPPPYRKR